MLRLLILAFLVVATPAFAADWPAPLPPTIVNTDGYVPISHPAVAPDKTRTYRFVVNVTRAGKTPDAPAMGVLQAGDTINTLRAGGVPMDHIQVVLAFHDAALDSILSEAAYKAKHGVMNPNLPILQSLKRHGVHLFVCGQNLAADNVDPKTLTPLVTIAADALVVLVTYQNRGYALLSF